MSKTLLKALNTENGGRFNLSRGSSFTEHEITFMKEDLVSEDTYVLAVCGTQSDSEICIGTALSDHSCVIYSLTDDTLDKYETLTHNSASIVGIKFSPTSRNIIYTATADGYIRMFDLRTKGKLGLEIKDDVKGAKPKPIASFDISCDERLLAGGTELINGDAFILFWDIRYSKSKKQNKNNLLGGYWESHTDDITSLSFNCSKRDVLASGSTDGLINIFDLTQSCEDSALIHSLNTESSVDRLGWLNTKSLWCTTHTFSLQFWNSDGATPYANFDRSQLAALQNDGDLKNTAADNCCPVRVHTNTHRHPMLLLGSNSSKGENLKCLGVSGDNFNVCYNLLGNKQIVRDSFFHEKSGCLITGGEAGILNVWKPMDLNDFHNGTLDELHLKASSTRNHAKQHRSKPY
ncbi:WD repeat-containing protein 89 [Leptopilina heterotoma]|uniref:WD repeat-containing protein 89 n=1 Tax=Leptopilina heterotoma TaxID=63436 RepID=UPI001CA7DB02|nr:WD repeat-containing protein 89 [Leptopilina heterotoma]